MFGSRFSFWEKKARDDRKPKIPVPVGSRQEKEQDEENGKSSSKTNSRKSSASEQGASSSTSTETNSEKEKDSKLSSIDPPTASLKIVMGKATQNGIESNENDVSALVVVSPVTANELHASSIPSDSQNGGSLSPELSNPVDENECAKDDKSIKKSDKKEKPSNIETPTKVKKKVVKKVVKVKKKVEKPIEKDTSKVTSSTLITSHSTDIASKPSDVTTPKIISDPQQPELKNSVATSDTSASSQSLSTSILTTNQKEESCIESSTDDKRAVLSASDSATETVSASQGTLTAEKITELDFSSPKLETTLSPEPVFDETEWKETEKVWFVRDNGFSAAHQLQFTGDPAASGLKDGKTRIRLHLSGETVTVDEDKVEKANSDECDRSEDISSLRYLNECGVLHTLQQRYNGNLVHTYAGPHLISLCPTYNQSAVTSDKAMQMFKGCRRSDMPPHIFAAAQTAYSEMTSTGADQSLLMTGHSGSGKSQNIRHVLKYLTTIAGTVNNQVTGDKLSAVTTLIESFSGAKTSQCDHASRAVNLYTLNFDRSGQVGSASVQCMLVEVSRVVRRQKNEENFSVFYQLVEGADAQLSRELFIVEDEQRENSFLFDSDASSKTELWKEEMMNGFKKLKSAMDTVGFTTDETKAIFNVLAACLHLGTAGSQKIGGSRYQFLKPDAAQKASSLLGFSIENLARAIFQPSSTPRTPSSPSVSGRNPASLQRTLSSSSASGDEPTGCSGQDNLEAFVTGLYTEVFRLVISVVNRCLSVSNFNAKSSLIVVDTPGMQCFESNNDNRTTFASLEDLAYNYVQERLQLLFHHNSFTRLQERYEQENVTCDFEPLEGDVHTVADSIDRPPSQSRVGASNLLTDSKGLLWLLDEEALIPGATEESFIERLSMFFGQPVKNGSPVMKKGLKRNHFILNHMMGNCPVEYDSSNWLKFCRENSLTKMTAEVLQDSKKKYISLTIGGRSSSGGTFQGSVVGLDNMGRSLTLRRGPSMRKVWTGSSSALNAAAVVKKKSLSMMKKLQVDSLIDALKRTNVHFVFCLTPHRTSVKGQENVIDVKLLTNQLRGFQLLPATRVHKQGYPEHIVFSEFRRCYEVLCKQLGGTKSGILPLPTGNGPLESLDDKAATEHILKTCDIERSQYRLGISQVLFRAGVLAQLEDRRNEKLTSVIVAIQSQCRGYLARKMYEKRKVQVVAIRCIQRNVKKFLVVRQWPWWRLLTKVLPLVEVHRTEEDLREKEAELELIKGRYDKVVAERDELKKENEKYEAQFNDVVGELSEEQATATHASEMLEQETRERIKLEREVKELQQHNHTLRQRCESVEVELAEQRLLHATDHDRLSDSDDDADVAEYKMRFDRLRREAEFKHKKEVQEYEEKVEQAEADKKHAEKKLHQIQEDLEEQERLVNQHKRKAQRTLAELNDARMHLEETNTKHHELEKKQRKFDSELYAVQAELTEMKTAKDRLQREKDQLSVEVYTKKNMLDENTGDIEVLQHKIERLEQELEETTAKDSEDGQMLNSLKKQRRELEAKLKDQEEELDEQAGQIQMLQQAKERLEMTTERTRQQHSREMDGKEEELEEMRVSYQKKIKHLENQLEEEEEERSAAMKGRRELEQQLAEFKNKQPFAKRDAEAEKRLRKDLKRYKALLDDAQTMIDHLKTDAVNKQQLKQMRAQLEESQYTCSNAVKARKAIELELEDVQAQLEEISKAKQEAEAKISVLQREKNELNSRIEEDDDDAKELARKYKNLVNQQCEDRKEIVELNSQMDDHKREKEMLNEKILTLQSQLEYLQDNTTDKSNVMRLESKVRDLDTKLDFEKTSSRRLEVQLERSKDQVDKLQSERDSQAASEHREKEQCKRLQKQLRDAKDEQSDILKREQEALQKQHELELEVMEYVNQNESLQADLKLAFKRISDLQIAFEDLEDSDMEGFSGSDNSDSDSDDGGGSRISSSWKKNRVPRSRVAGGSVSTSSVLSSKHSIASEDDFAYRRRKRAPSPDESKFSDSSTSTVRSFEKETEKERKERARKTRKKLLKELKYVKTNGESPKDFSDILSHRTASVVGGAVSIAEDFAKESDMSGRSTVMSKMSFGFTAGVKDTMSLCGDLANDDIDFDSVSMPDMSARPSSAMGTGGKYESGTKSRILSRVGKAGGRNAIKLELDRMSKTLADEDPSVLLYSSPADISGKLGLGKTRSFRALNENIMAVKSRQNLPEKQKKKLAIVDKVNSDISTMKEDLTLEKISGRRSIDFAKRRESRESFGSSGEQDDACSLFSTSSGSSKISAESLSTRNRNFSVQSEAAMGRVSMGNSYMDYAGDNQLDDYNSVDTLTRGRPSSRNFSRTDADLSEIQVPRRSRFLKDFNFGTSSQVDMRSANSKIRQKSRNFNNDEDSYYTDGEYTIPTRIDRRRTTSASHGFDQNDFSGSISNLRLSRKTGNFDFDSWSDLDEDYSKSSPIRTSSRMSGRNPQSAKRISPRDVSKYLGSVIGSRSSGSWESDNRSNNSFDDDDVSLSQYGIDDNNFDHSDIQPTRQTSRRSFSQQKIVGTRSNHGMNMMPRMLNVRPNSKSGQRFDYEDVGSPHERGRSVSRTGRDNFRSASAASFQQRGMSVDARSQQSAAVRTRSSSRSGTRTRMQERTAPDTTTLDDSDISIDSIISKYLYKT
ncbi:unconventional myosin-XVIIIa-like isoform X2 [Styela clava]